MLRNRLKSPIVNPAASDKWIGERFPDTADYLWTLMKTLARMICRRREGSERRDSVCPGGEGKVLAGLGSKERPKLAIGNSAEDGKFDIGLGSRR